MCGVCQERLNDKKEALLEKELILEEASRETLLRACSNQLKTTSSLKILRNISSKNMPITFLYDMDFGHSCNIEIYRVHSFWTQFE